MPCPVSSEIPLSGEPWSKAPHPIDQAVKGKRHRLEGLGGKTQLVDELLQSALVPPAEMIGRGIQHKIWDLGERRCSMRHDYAKASFWSYGLDQIASEAQRVRDVLDDV